MSFGAVQSAISSIKSNRNLLSTRSRLKNTLSSNQKKKFELKASNAKPNELKTIRERLKTEHKQIRMKQMIILCLFMSVLVSIFLFFI